MKVVHLMLLSGALVSWTGLHAQNGDASKTAQITRDLFRSLNFNDQIAVSGMIKSGATLRVRHSVYSDPQTTPLSYTALKDELQNCLSQSQRVTSPLGTIDAFSCVGGLLNGDFAVFVNVNEDHVSGVLIVPRSLVPLLDQPDSAPVPAAPPPSPRVEEGISSSELPVGPPSKAIRVSGAESELRVIPQDAARQGISYQPLAEDEALLAATIAKAIVSEPAPSELLNAQHLDVLPGVYVSETFPSGVQRVHRGSGSIYSLPTRDKQCSFGTPVSLGRDGNRQFAFVQISCRAEDPKWDQFVIGMTMKAGQIEGVALNTGDRLNLFPQRPNGKVRASK